MQHGGLIQKMQAQHHQSVIAYGGLREQARRLVDAGNYAAAEPVLRRLVATGANDPEVWWMLDIVQAHVGPAYDPIILPDPDPPAGGGGLLLLAAAIVGIAAGVAIAFVPELEPVRQWLSDMAGRISATVTEFTQNLDSPS